MPRRLAVGALVVDRDARKASHAGEELVLSRIEFDLLAHLAAQPARVFSKWSSCATCGACGLRGTPAPSTRTPAGCARSSRERGRRT
jgi:hypothetical protein